MKTINLYFDFEFTSLSPDAQPISLGIVSDGVLPAFIPINKISIEKLPKSTQEEIKELKITTFDVIGYDNIRGKKVIALAHGKNPFMFVSPSWIDDITSSRTFYAEFSDFDINRCDDWVKTNVVDKLIFRNIKADFKTTVKESFNKDYRLDIDLKDSRGFTVYMDNYKKGQNDLRVIHDDNPIGEGTVSGITQFLNFWLDNFKDYQIQFVKDAKSTKGVGLDWLTLVELLRIDNPLKNYVLINLTKGYKAIIDKEDYSAVSKHSWCASDSSGKCYPETRIKGKLVRLHQFVMGDTPKEGLIRDHINGNSLDNRKSNLRWITRTQNNYNTSSRKSTSIYKGVRFNKKNGSWNAFISKGGKYNHLGVFNNEIDAAKAYNNKAIEFFGEYCKLNEFNNLPKLPGNISPAPADLNDLIAFKKGISHKEAFDLNREEMVSNKGVWLIPNTAIPSNITKEELVKEIKSKGIAVLKDVKDCKPVYIAANSQKHNALWDAKVIKEIYQKLK